MKKYLDWVIRTIVKAGWAPILVFTIHLVSARVYGIYTYYPNFDDIMHFSGGCAISFFFINALIIGKELKVFIAFNKFSFITSVFAYTSTVTIFWEFLEWASDHYLGTYMQNGIDDTMLDMALGMTGGLLVVLSSLLIIEKNFFEK